MTTRIKHLYLHVPFCQTICAYCDFCHVVYHEPTVNKWLAKIETELTAINNQFETIYLGGGTPSCLNEQQLERLLTLIDPLATKVKEYTIEVNPETINNEKLKIIQKHHVNRVSIGLQSSNERLLKLLNRKHNFVDVKNLVEQFKALGINNLSLDIMYSLPTQTMEDLKETLDAVLSLDVPHLSLYSLTVEENTLFGKKGYQALDDDTEADMYEYIEKVLTTNNYVHYEIANFAQAGYESKHNLGYWNYDDYLGVGAGATGKYNHCRYVGKANLNEYLSSNQPYEKEELSKREEAFENIMMSLRTVYGLDIKRFNERYNLDFLKDYAEAIEKNKASLSFKDGHCICDKLEILNSILLDFMDE